MCTLTAAWKKAKCYMLILAFSLTSCHCMERSIPSAGISASPDSKSASTNKRFIKKIAHSAKKINNSQFESHKNLFLKKFGTDPGPQRFVLLFEHAKAKIIPESVNVSHLFLRAKPHMFEADCTYGRFASANVYHLPLLGIKMRRTLIGVVQYDNEFFENLCYTDDEVSAVFGHELVHYLQALGKTPFSDCDDQKAKEIEADLVSAKKLECAQAHINKFCLVFDFLKFKYPDATLDDHQEKHPTLKNRITALTPMAEKQQKNVPRENRQKEIILWCLQHNQCYWDIEPCHTDDEEKKEDIEFSKAILFKLYRKIENDKITPLPKNRRELASIYAKMRYKVYKAQTARNDQ